MIESLKQLWKRTEDGAAPRKKHTIVLAVAALMTEIMRMDGRLEKTEHEQILHLLQQRFQMDEAEIRALIERAQATAEQALDLHQFTSVIIQHYSTAERQDIIADLWSVAMADGHVDPYEEQLIRRTSELIGLGHRQFIAAKLEAQEA